MRQVKREIKDPAQLESVIQQADICRLGLHNGDYPYVVPMNFGYAEGCLYFHCAPEGLKVDLIRQDNRVGFELEAEAMLDKHPDLACKWETRFKSVIGYGRAFLITDVQEKRRALDVLMAHYAESQVEWGYNRGALAKMIVVKVVIERMTGKQSRHHTRSESGPGDAD